VIHYHRNRDAAESTAKEAGGARLAQGDLRSMQDIEQLVRSLADTRFDILINNAGLWGFTPLGSTTLESLEGMLDVNVKAVFWLTQALLPLLNEGARIVNLSSIAGRIGRAGGRSRRVHPELGT